MGDFQPAFSRVGHERRNAGQAYRPDPVRRVTPAGNHSSGRAIAGAI